MTNVHSCSYYCDRPECIKAQRDELRERLALARPCCQDFDKCQQACMPRAAAAEREACAKVCYEVFDKTGLWAALQLSDKIRARGDT